MARVIFLTDFSESYARSLLLGIARYAHEKGQAWSLCRLPLSIRDKFGIEKVIKIAQRLHADAVIGQFYNSDEVELFKKNNLLAVAQDFQSRFDSIPNITGAYTLAGKIGAEYFINKGFKNFGFYGIRGIQWSEERYKGFRDTIMEANPDFTFSVFRNSSLTDFWLYDPIKLFTWLESLPKPVAIMACDDNQAYYITEACHIEGGGRFRIPNDIAVLGVDNDETICRLSSPNLSSLGQNIEQGGYDVAQLIDQKLNTPEKPTKDVIVYPTTVITRESTDIYATTDPYISTILKYIYQNINMKISVQDLVKLVPLSRRLLENHFKKNLGTSIYDYIINVRVEKMSQLLCQGFSVSDAAAELGFADIKNISRTFKQIKGITPSEYRQQMQENITYHDYKDMI